MIKHMTKGALIILQNETGKVLLQHKDGGAPMHPNKWCLLGGGIEPHESAGHALNREFKEELEWDITEFNHFANYADNDVFFARTKQRAEDLKEKLHEGDDLAYFSEQEIAKLNIAAPHKQILQDFFKRPKTIHFICRGNTFRSIIAEAYLKSLQIDGVKVVSSGSVAHEHKKANESNFLQTVDLLQKHGLKKFVKPHHADQLTQELLDHTDVAIVMNDLVFEDIEKKFKLPHETYYWDIADIGEGNRILKTNEDRSKYQEEVFDEISHHIDKLIADGLGA